MEEITKIARSIDYDVIENIVSDLKILKEMKGRVFVIGIGGSAGNASHMVNDLRKLCEIEAYAPTDNVSEITARTNDEGFDTIFEEYLRISNFDSYDMLFVLSVGGGNLEKNISVALCKGINYARSKHGTICGIVGRTDGYTVEHAHHCVKVPLTEEQRITPHSEAFQTVVWHCIVSHPKIQIRKTKW